MPVDWKKYPKNWKEIAIRKKESTGWICEQCKKRCRRPDEPFKGHWYTLTVAHMNHNPMDNRPENLKALCAPCHLRYDAARHVETRRKNRKTSKNEEKQLWEMSKIADK